jgi:hypothetical protein
MPGSGRDEKFLTGIGPMNLTRDFEFDRALDYHDQLVCRMHVVLPTLSRRIYPKVAAETAFAPVQPNLL